MKQTTVHALTRAKPLDQVATWPLTAIFILCVLIYLAALGVSVVDPQYSAPKHGWAPQLDALALLGSNQADLSLNGAEYWRLMTNTFLHRNLIHIIFNLFLFASFGVITLANFGIRRFWLLVVCCGLTGSVFSVDSFFLGVPPYHATGLTPVLFGFLGVHWVFLKHNQNHLMAERIKGLLIWGHLIFIALSFLDITPVDHFGHLGAMFAGMGLGFWFESEPARRWGAQVEKAILFLAGWFLAWGWYQVFLTVESLPV